MSQDDAARTRRSLHGVAELVLAGPQYAACGSIRLRVLPGGFATVEVPDVRVEGLELVTPSARVGLDGTFWEVADAVGVRAPALADVYAGGPDVDVHETIDLDPDHVRELLDALAVGDAALRQLAPDHRPVLWPEHLDVGATVAEVNSGVSPGDDHLAEPYAYVGPWVARDVPSGTRRSARSDRSPRSRTPPPSWPSSGRERDERWPTPSPDDPHQGWAGAVAERSAAASRSSAARSRWATETPCSSSARRARSGSVG